MDSLGLRGHVIERARFIVLAVAAALVLASCGVAAVSNAHGRKTAPPGAVPATSTGQAQSSATSAATAARAKHRLTPLHKPKRLRPFDAQAAPRQGRWRGVGRKVAHHRAVFETTMVPPGGTQPAGIAWMDTRLLVARLYSGSESPGGGPYRFTAPIRPAQAHSLVAAFNGGFKMAVAGGGYYTQHRAVYPLRRGAASLVIYRGGSVNVGVWGRHFKMTKNVVAVRQNLVLMVSRGHLTARAKSTDWPLWGATCGASSCSSGVPGIENQWRSAVGVTARGALVYVQGPGLSPLQLARLLLRARVVRGMEFDINPYWPIFATYDPARPHGLAAAANGHGLLAGTTQTPATFFNPGWARDFITMSARHHRH